MRVHTALGRPLHRQDGPQQRPTKTSLAQTLLHNRVHKTQRTVFTRSITNPEASSSIEPAQQDRPLS